MCKTPSLNPNPMLCCHLHLITPRSFAASATAAALVGADLKSSEADKVAYKLDDFELLTTLGTGSFGRVRFAKHKATGAYHAIKMLKKGEILRLKQVDHIISGMGEVNWAELVKHGKRVAHW
jgi:serine/threonine protein kinase